MYQSFIKVFCCALMLAGFAAISAEPKRIYIANDDHTDFMWSADADTYANAFIGMIDFHLKLADVTATNPPAFRNRFNCDGSYWLWTYEQKKSPAEFARLIERVKDGTISAPLNTLVSCYGGQPAEAVLRGMYYSGRLERRYHLRFPLVAAMENQTLPLGLASLFAGAGAEYSWRGVCGCASKINNSVLGERPREIYWWAGHDGRRLLLKWYSLGGPGVGGYWEAGSPASAIRYVDSNTDFLRRYRDPKTHEPYNVIGLFGFGGDDLARKTGIAPPPVIPGVPGLQKVVSSPYCDHFFNIAQQESNDRRNVVVSNEKDFFEDFEKNYGASLDSQTVTYGNEWDLYSASMSETSARAKRAVEKLRSAELLTALVSLKYPRFMTNHSAARDRAFNDLGIFWEHNWTADGPVSRPQRAAWEEMVVSEIEYYCSVSQTTGVIFSLFCVFS
ncbi:MAG: glycoside hydrolase, partial [Verrucomicrobiota bacterium]